MKQWYQRNRRLFIKERDSLAASCPLMMLSIVGPEFRINRVSVTKGECALAHGTYILSQPSNQNEIKYGIALIIPANYPKSFPIMFCNDSKLPIGNIDRHILSDGQACLEVRTEIKRRWPQGSSITDFLQNLVEPFLAWQLYYDAFSTPPEWGERKHGIEGIIQYYAEIIGQPADDTIIGFMKLLARKNQPKGHEYCPCGSGERIRHCHGQLIREVRDRVPWSDVATDLTVMQKYDPAKKTDSLLKDPN